MRIPMHTGIEDEMVQWLLDSLFDEEERRMESETPEDQIDVRSQHEFVERQWVTDEQYMKKESICRALVR